MSRITDYILEPKVVYTDGGFLVRVKVIDDYKYKKYIVSENLHYNTVQGTSFTLTDADSTKQASILELKGNTSQEGTPTPSSPVEVKTVSGDNKVYVVGKNLAKTKEGSYSYNNYSSWDIENGVITTTINDITYQGGALNLQNGVTGRWSSSSIADLHLTKNGGSYTITGIKEGTLNKGTNGNLYTYVFVYKDNGTYRNDYILYNDNVQSKVINLASDEHIGCLVMYSQYVTCENLKIKVQLEKRNTSNNLHSTSR